MGRTRHLPAALCARSLLQAVGRDCDATAAQRRLVNRKLAWVVSFRQSKQGPPRGDDPPQPTPRDGRSGAFPGTHLPGESDDPDNRDFLRWVLLFVSTLYVLRVRYTDVAAQADMDNETLKDLLTGVRYGKAETRLRATWALFKCMLEAKFTLEALLTWIENDGNWMPCWPVVGSWDFDGEGFVVYQLPALRPAVPTGAPVVANRPAAVVARMTAGRRLNGGRQDKRPQRQRRT